jgi:hypothetical protein
VITDDPDVAANARSVGLVVDEQAAPQFARMAAATGATAAREAAIDLAAEAAPALPPLAPRAWRPEPAPGEAERKGESFPAGRRPEPPPPVRP